MSDNRSNMVELTTLMYWHRTLDEWAERFDLMTREKSKQQAGDDPVEQFAIRMHDLGKRLSNLADVFNYVEQLEKRADPAKDAMREALEFTRYFGCLLKRPMDMVDEGIELTGVINPEAIDKIAAALALDNEQNDAKP